MTSRFLAALGLSLALVGAYAQTTPTDPKPAGGDEAKPAVRETPPDQKAYTDATRITDADKKIEALEKFRKDFPDSMYASSVDSTILTTLIQKMPDQKARIKKTAQAMYAASTAKDKAASKNNTIVTMDSRGFAAGRIADQLLSGDILLKDAESYAKKSLDSLQQSVWMSEQREAFQKRKQKIPSDEELTKRFQQLRAGRLATLGQVENKLGRTAMAQKLLEEAYAVNPASAPVAAALGEMAAKAGNDAKAMDYLISAKLTGNAPDTANTAFEATYKKAHNGSLDGLETMLDTEYQKRFPNPVHVEAYKPTAARTDRVVLAEVFTGSGCPPCAGADIAFDAAMERYARKDLAVVMYHLHIPRPDPMTNPDTQARAKFYSVNAVPSFTIDGKKTVGGGSRDMAPGVYDRFNKDLEKDLETAAEAKIKVDAGLNGGNVKVSAAIDGVESESKDLKVQILLVEKEIRHLGENGVRFHPMVVRAVAGEKAEGFKLEPKGKGAFDASFDLETVSKALKAHLDEFETKRGNGFKFSAKRDQINRAGLAVVVFVQDDKTKHVLQAAYVDLGGAPGTRPTTLEANGNDLK
jgi:thiol-disulfide isomerase/thioredoxin